MASSSNNIFLFIRFLTFSSYQSGNSTHVLCCILLTISEEIVCSIFCLVPFVIVSALISLEFEAFSNAAIIAAYNKLLLDFFHELFCKSSIFHIIHFL